MAVEQVILLVDRAHGARITELPASAALWLVDSPENRPCISALKSKFTPEAPGELTWFADMPQLSPAEIAATMIDSIEDHHGKYSQHPPFRRLTIIGAAAEACLLNAVAELGFREAPSVEPRLEFER